jgi:tRNA dimethylallyltransferase
MNKTLVVIIGPTGIGKTKISIEVASYLSTEIISADSRQFFREMKTGTAVPSAEDQMKIRHHFVHQLGIHDYYNASQYEHDALVCLEKLFGVYDTVILTGGSMLYIDAVCNGIDEVPDVDPEVRNNLKVRFSEAGIESLRLELKKADPEYYKMADLKNPKRIIHALEVCYTTGKPYSAFRNQELKSRSFTIIKIGLNCERKVLFERINNRVDEMINNGLIDEAKQLLPYRYLNSLNTVGYKELFEYFDGKTDLTEAVRLIKRNTRRYARKQLTWFLKDKEINWFHFNDINRIIEFINSRIYE